MLKMRKEKFNLEYVFNKASRNNLWNYVSTPSGLSEWFADDVSKKENLYIFNWNKTAIEAQLLTVVPNTCIRFRWIEDENPESYFEFKLHKDELTGAIVLDITDFADPEEKEETIVLWEKQIKELTQMLGI